MPKKVFELAKELEMNSLDLVEKLKGMGFQVRNHMNSLSDEDLVKFNDLSKPAEGKKKVTKKKTTKKKEKRGDGSSSNFDKNAGIVLESNGKPAGSRILGPTSEKFRVENFNRIAALSPALI